MTNLLSCLLIILCLIACEKENVTSEPLTFHHIMDFVDGSGENIFESNQIHPSEFQYGTQSMEEVLNSRKYFIELFKKQFTGHADTAIEVLEKNKYFFVEGFQGYKQRELDFNGEEYLLKLSPLNDGIYLDDMPLYYSTDTLSDEYFIYVHHIKLIDSAL